MTAKIKQSSHFASSTRDSAIYNSSLPAVLSCNAGLFAIAIENLQFNNSADCQRNVGITIHGPRNLAGSARWCVAIKTLQRAYQTGTESAKGADRNPKQMKVKEVFELSD